MPQSFANILVHVVFSTMDRMPWLKDDWRDHLHGYAGGIIRRCGSDLIAVNSVSDHIHLLFPLPKTRSMAELVRELKSGTSTWIREGNPAIPFRWQSGYGAFSVSPGHRDAVVQYIADQQAHHLKITFQEEYRRLLEKYHFKPDERHMWE